MRDGRFDCLADVFSNGHIAGDGQPGRGKFRDGFGSSFGIDVRDNHMSAFASHGRAHSRPIPLPPPVTTITLPDRRFAGIQLLDVSALEPGRTNEANAII